VKDGIREYLLQLRPEEVLVTTHGAVQAQLRRTIMQSLEDAIVVHDPVSRCPVIIPHSAIRYLEIVK